MNMEQKAFYVVPETELRAAKIRCSILAGSNGQNSEVKPTSPSSSASGDNVGFGDARVRKSDVLGF